VVRPVDKKLYRNYLQKAEEMLEMARYGVTTSKNNATVVASIHCAINAMDALSIFYFGKRQSGEHENAVDLVRGALSEGEFKEVAKQFGGLIELKNQAEYQPDLLSQRQAADAVRRADRILSKVKEKLH
jgi:HEPN domain-containing protein